MLLEDLVPLLALELIHPDVQQLLLLDNALLGILRVETQRSFVVKRNLRRVVDPLHLALVLGYVDPSSLERTTKSASGFGSVESMLGLDKNRRLTALASSSR